MTAALDLAALERLAEAATPGPWVVDSARVGHPNHVVVMEEGELIDWVCSMQVSNRPRWQEDAAFIAAARTALPQAVAVIKELHAAGQALVDDIHEAFPEGLASLDGVGPLIERLEAALALVEAGDAA